MNKKIIYVFLFDGFSDWELSYALPEINKSDQYTVVSFGLTQAPVQSMGGLTLIPTIGIDELKIENTAMLLIPGGDAWEEKKYRELIPLLHTLQKARVPVAAICAATSLLADAGLLDSVRHTSNGKDYLKKISPDYAGEKYYLEQPAVSDKNLLTANGTAPIEFAREIFRSLNLFDNGTIGKWFNLFKHGIWIE